MFAQILSFHFDGVLRSLAGALDGIIWLKFVLSVPSACPKLTTCRMPT